MKPLILAVFGASSAYGVGDDSGGVAGRLAARYRDDERVKYVYNLGIPGESSDTMTPRLEAELAARGVNATILILGSNDVKREGSSAAPTRRTSEESDENETRLIEAAKRFGPVVLVGQTPVDEARTTPVAWRPVFWLAADVERLAQERSRRGRALDVTIVDVFDDVNPEDSHDGLHMAPRGYALVAKRVAEALEHVLDSMEAKSV